jgi:soluble lytic murein transglycosylase
MTKMKNITIRFILLWAALTVVGLSHAGNGDEFVLKAREAFGKENVVALSAHVAQLEAQQHILTPYAQYWLLMLKINQTDNQIISNFLTQHADYAFEHRLRGEYLKKLGKSKNWEQFLSEYALYKSDNAAVDCYAAEAYHTRPNTGSLLFAKSLWLNEKERPSDCDRLFDQLQSAGIVDEDAIWQRFRMALGVNHIGLSQSIAKRSKQYEPSQQKLINDVSKSPEKMLKNKQISFKTRFERELNLYALTSLAKQDTLLALAEFKKIQDNFNADEQSYFYSMLGLSAAKRHEAEAQVWFNKADIDTLNDEQFSWFARAALRQKDWVGLLAVINKMPSLIANEARWRYWKARALMAAQPQDEEAVGILTSLAPERHYYGWLAQDELNKFKMPTLTHYRPTQEEVAHIASRNGVKRAEALLALDLRWEGKQEWEKAVEGFSDKELLAAAEFANHKQWFDLAINTADKTTELHDFSLRYLMPYKSLMKKAADLHNVDETWAHGITRQESRFMHYAKSNVGAAGLMQLMPTTARWAAKRAGVNDYKTSMIHNLDTNVTIGTYYLRYTLDMMSGNKVMATAGYNAGPSRAKRWQANQPLEGAIYAETIPFNETRIYVQRVMANTHMYAQQLGNNHLSLKHRMGTIPAKASLSASN